MTGSRRALLLLLVLLADLRAGEDADSLLKAFHERFDKESQASRRRDAVLTLKGHPSGKVVEELTTLLAKRRQTDDYAVVEGLCEVLASFDSPTAASPLLDMALKPRALPKDILFVREALKPCRNPAVLKAVAERGLASEDPLVLEAMADVLGEAAQAPSASRLKPLLEHREARVRAAAAEAYGRCAADPKGAAALRPLLASGEPIVADSALAGLAWVRSAEDWPAIAKAIEKGAWPLRCRLYRALGTWKDDEGAVSALIAALDREHGRALPVLAASLEQATGQKLGTDAKAWKGWWASRHGGGPATTEVDTGGGKPQEYFGVRFFCDRVVFVEDVSGSMSYGAVEAKGSAALKIDRSKAALSKAVAGLDPRTSFNILAFSSVVQSWKPAPVAATPENLKDAGKFIENLKAFGTTNIRDAIGQAAGGLMKRRPKGGYGSGYGTDGPDTLFLLTDGRPTQGIPGRGRMGGTATIWDDAYDLLTEFTFGNRFQDIQCFVMGMSGDPKNQDDIDPVFLELMARWNGGTYTFLK